MRMLVISFVLIAACSPSATKSPDCLNFPTTPGNQTIGKVYNLPDADPTLPAIGSARDAIGRCYPKMSHDTSGYELVRKDVKADESSRGFVLTYRLKGISDVAIAFRTDRSGQVIEVFEYSIN